MTLLHILYKKNSVPNLYTYEKITVVEVSFLWFFFNVLSRTPYKWHGNLYPFSTVSESAGISSSSSCQTHS